MWSMFNLINILYLFFNVFNTQIPELCCRNYK